MSYTALYRKFRPGEFDEVKGQEHIVTTLRNQIQTERIGHAYLFCGTRGTGKTTVAKILAKAVNCQHPVNGNPCNECEICKKINNQTSMNVIEIDAASNNGVGNIRDIIEEVQYSPAEGKYKVYIIDEVHMLSTGAFNALLKTLEEPPSYVIFILATTEPHKIPITIHSRCQRYDFRRISIDTIEARLRELVDKEQVQAEEKALRYIAKTADGSLRDALSLLDQCIAFYLGQELTYERALEVLGAVDTAVYSRMFQYITVQNVIGCVELLDEMMAMGRDLEQFISEFIWYLRGLMLVDASEQGGDLLDVSQEQLQQMKEEGKMTDVNTLIRYIRILSELSNQLRYASQKRVLFEVTLIKLCRPQMDQPQDVTTLSNRLTALENKIERGELTVKQGNSSPAGGESQQEAPRKEEPKILPKALPEDIREVLNRWNEILVAYGQPGENMLSQAKRILSDRGTLLLQFTDEVAEGFFIQNSGQELQCLKNVIQGIIGKEIVIETRTVDGRVNDKYEDIAQMIHFDGIEYV
ncbi:MAG: DNA polymerase III subunit gamma/tau [Butyribacter sp.]|nr:DNA polymerase III subunit gamma/tau [bacterium]MDY3853750.1 DNA polymerase III subunit gamma/tau [Butyribacter sp.]